MHKGHHRCAVQRWGGSPDGPGSRRRRNARRNGSAAALGGGAGGLVGTWLAKLLGDQRAPDVFRSSSITVGCCSGYAPGTPTPQPSIRPFSAIFSRLASPS